MTSVIVWCLLLVPVEDESGFINDTAVKGKVISESKTSYLVDFSEYAKLQGYSGNFNRKLVDKDTCVKE